MGEKQGSGEAGPAAGGSVSHCSSARLNGKREDECENDRQKLLQQLRNAPPCAQPGGRNRSATELRSNPQSKTTWTSGAHAGVTAAAERLKAHPL